MSSPSPFEPPLDKPRHLRYWQRCARTLLPHHYTSNDSQRLSLGFFIIAAIDLLSHPEEDSNSSSSTTKPLLTPSDRRTLHAWVLSCQHPDGGFCGSPTHVFSRAHHDGGDANIAATYFALLLLPMLTEDADAEGGAYAGVDRAATLRWLRRLQRVGPGGDGSFGEVVYEVPPLGGGAAEARHVIGGGRDMRYCYLAASIRWILRGDGDDIDDIDVPALVRHIRRSQSYDGGFSESLGHESHAGYAYCAVAALALLGRPAEGAGAGGGVEQPTSPRGAQGGFLQEGIGDIPQFVSFLASRPLVYLEPQAKGGAQGGGDDHDEDPEAANFRMASLSLSDPGDDDKRHIGYNGRCNKPADTCYTWWVLGSLSILGAPVSASPSSSSSSSSPPPPPSPSQPAPAPGPSALSGARAFLLERTQHAIGGFGKRAASPPDIYHSCLGLFALAAMGDPSLRELDAALAVSAATVAKIEAGRRGLLRRARAAEGGSGFAEALVGMAASMGGGGGGERPAWLGVAV